MQLSLGFELQNPVTKKLFSLFEASDLAKMQACSSVGLSLKHAGLLVVLCAFEPCNNDSWCGAQKYARFCLHQAQFFLRRIG